MKPYKLTSRDPKTSFAKGWSGVQESERCSVEAAIAWFTAEAIDQPGAVHILETPDGHVLAVYQPQ